MMAIRDVEKFKSGRFLDGCDRRIVSKLVERRCEAMFPPFDLLFFQSLDQGAVPGLLSMAKVSLCVCSFRLRSLQSLVQPCEFLSLLGDATFEGLNSIIGTVKFRLGFLGLHVLHECKHE